MYDLLRNNILEPNYFFGNIWMPLSPKAASSNLRLVLFYCLAEQGRHFNCKVINLNAFTWYENKIAGLLTDEYKK